MHSPLIALALIVPPLLVMATPSAAQPRQRPSESREAVQMATAQGNSPTELREFIDQQVGGIEKLQVPEDNAELPQPRLPDGSLEPFCETTEAKRYLGKQLFHDPVRTARILPEFGGVPDTRQTASCGSCHLGEAASKAGTLFNLGVGGEGRGFTDAEGNFVPRRRIQPGMVDTIPTLTDIFEGGFSPPQVRRGMAPAGVLVQSGAADAVDSVPRNVPTMIGFAFNNRLLQGGLAGEPDTSAGADNPDGFVAGENLTQAATSVHRMFQFQAAELQQIAVYRKLFMDAFPEEAVQAIAQNDLNLLINDETVLRAMATFLRTVVTRNTPWDHFLAGDNGALTSAQRRGARLFFTSAEAGGAGCVSCHSGPMLHKQLGDEEGLLVEENFYNLGLSDHPLQDLNAEVLNDPSHRDRGRMDVTGSEDDAFKFRVLSLRQLKDGLFFMHNGSFTRLRDVVAYFNDGLPQDPEAAVAGTLTPRFTHPRGLDSSRGLGLDDEQIDDLTDFLENALYDPAFLYFDPDSTTDTFQLNERDLTYSTFRPDLAALGAVDGLMASGMAQANNDALSRRDMGLEFLDVTAQVDIVLIASDSFDDGQQQEDVYGITNNGSGIVDTDLLIVAQGLAEQIEMTNASGITATDDPYCREFLPNGVLLPGQSMVKTLRFTRQSHDPPVSYTLLLLSGQGNP